MRRHYRPVIYAGAALIALAGRAAAQPPATKVVLEEARRFKAPATITVVGTVDPSRTTRVGAEIAGRVQDMPAREGDYVEEGAVICQLDDKSLQLRLAEERARLERLKAAHEELLAGTRKEELKRLRALLEEAAADYERWKLEMERVRKLYTEQESNQKEYYDTQAELLRAQQRKEAAEAAYELGVAGPRQEVIAQAAHEVGEQQAIVEQILDEIDKTRVRAPFSGYIVERLTEVGAWISEGGPVVDMVDLQPVLVRVDVPESALPYLQEGDQARVIVDALGRSFSGYVRHVIRQAAPNARTFPIKIEVANDDRLLAGGMFARATVPAGPSEEVLAVPKDAIVEREGTAYVALAVPGRGGDLVGTLTPVTRGADVGDWVAITSGNIEDGAQVIVRGTERIMPFPTPIEVVDEHGTPVPVAMPDGDKQRSGGEGV